MSESRYLVAAVVIIAAFALAACGDKSKPASDDAAVQAEIEKESGLNAKEEELARREAELASGTALTVTEPRAFILRPGEGRSINLGNFAMSLKASAEDTANAFTLLQADEPPGFGPPMHIHHDAAEAFYVLTGEYKIYIRDKEFASPEGSFIYIPAGVPHGFRVGPRPSRKLNLYSPAAMVGYFDDLSAALARGAADAELAGIAERHGMEIIGSVPEGYL